MLKYQELVYRETVEQEPIHYGYFECQLAKRVQLPHTVYRDQSR